MSRQPIVPRRVRDRWLALGLLAILLGSFFLAWNAWDRPSPTFRLRVTGGRLPGPKQRLAQVLAHESTRRGVDLILSECPGSIESLDEVNDGRVEVALVQGGLDSKRWTEVRQVAALHVEPLQLVVREELYAAVAVNLRALKGRSINLGEPGSGSEALARQVLGFVGLRDGSGDYRPWFKTHRELQEIGSAGALPDAVMTVSSLPTPMIRDLVTKWNYRLVPIPFAEAFALGDIDLDDGPADLDPSRLKASIDRVHLQETHVPAFTYGVEPAVPASRLPTLGTRILVVTNRKTDPEAVRRLLEAIYLSDFAEVARPPLETSLLELPPEFPLHPGTSEFLQRNKPLIVGDAVDFLEKTSSLTGAILGGLFVTWQWARRRYRRRRELGFESYLLKVTAIEHEALLLELASQLDLAPLLALQADLGRLKNQAMQRFTQGELEGEGLMSGFLTHSNDARDYLARLILHARTTIEKQARKQGLSPDAAWALAIGGADLPHPEPPDGAALADRAGRPLE